MSVSKTQAQDFIKAVKEAGWEISRVGNTIVTISKTIGVQNNSDFCQADSEYYGLLAMIPGKGGSIWGTDGGGIGALSAMKNGVFTMNKSGVQSRFINALEKEGC